MFLWHVQERPRVFLNHAQDIEDVFDYFLDELQFYAPTTLELPRFDGHLQIFTPPRRSCVVRVDDRRACIPGNTRLRDALELCHGVSRGVYLSGGARPGAGDHRTPHDPLASTSLPAHPDCRAPRHRRWPPVSRSLGIARAIWRPSSSGQSSGLRDSTTKKKLLVLDSAQSRSGPVQQHVLLTDRETALDLATRLLRKCDPPPGAKIAEAMERIEDLLRGHLTRPPD